METIKRHPLLSITIVAALLRLPTIGLECLWYDETFTVWLATLPLPNLVEATAGDVHPPLWYLIEWVMVALLGSSNIAMRLVSGLAGVALIPAVYRLALAFNFDRSRALAAAALTAVAPFMVYYSQEARAYSLIFLLTTLSTIAVLERRYWLLIVTASAALYLHNLTCLYIAALAWQSLYYRRLPEWRNMLISFTAIGMIWLPWLVWGLLGQVSDVSSGFWVRTPTIGTPIFIITNWVFSPAAYMLVLVTVPLIALACLQIRPSHTTAQLLGLTLIPMGLCIIIGAITHPILIDRVIGSSAIPFYLLIAPTLTLQPVYGRWRYALTAMFAAVLVVFYAAYFGTNKIGRYDYDGHMAEFKKMANPVTDGLYHANLATYIIENYYLPEFEQAVWPQSNDLSQSLTTRTKTAMMMNQADFESVACNRQRWWILFYENPTTGDNERREIGRIVDTYNGRMVDVIAKNKFVYSRIYLIEGACQHYAAR